jgi:6-phospho-3-hexuloisomerase
LVTASPGSSIARLAACVVHIPGPTPKSKEAQSATSVQPMASLFEQCLLVVLDTIVLLLMDRKGWSGDRMFGQHANLE